MIIKPETRNKRVIERLTLLEMAKVKKDHKGNPCSVSVLDSKVVKTIPKEWNDMCRNRISAEGEVSCPRKARNIVMKRLRENPMLAAKCFSTVSVANCREGLGNAKRGRRITRKKVESEARIAKASQYRKEAAELKRAKKMAAKIRRVEQGRL